MSRLLYDALAMGRPPLPPSAPSTSSSSPPQPSPQQKGRPAGCRFHCLGVTAATQDPLRLSVKSYVKVSSLPIFCRAHLAANETRVRIRLSVRDAFDRVEDVGRFNELRDSSNEPQASPPGASHSFGSVGTLSRVHTRSVRGYVPKRPLWF